jgi:hypothetical protein
MLAHGSCADDGVEGYPHTLRVPKFKGTVAPWEVARRGVNLDASTRNALIPSIDIVNSSRAQ